jgi:hypothetical protein
MKSHDSVEVLIYKHPFKTERETIYVEKDTFRKIYTGLELEWDIEDYIILDGDEIVTDFTQMPKNDYICIKCVPKGGGGDYAEEGQGMKAVGGGIAALGLGIALLATGPIGIAIGASIAISGLMTLGYGQYLYNYEVDSSTYSGYEPEDINSPSISGSRNSGNPGGIIPVLLGKHLVYPFTASTAYVSSPSNAGSQYLAETTGDQYLHLLLCGGYKQMSIDISTLRYGDIPYDSYDFGDVTTPYEFLESSTQGSYYSQRVSQESVSEELTSYEDFEADTLVVPYIEKTTSTNTKRVVITVAFPVGHYRINEGQDPAEYTTKPGQVAINPDIVEEASLNYQKNSTAKSAFVFEWKHTGADDSTYQKFGTNTYYATVSSGGPAESAYTLVSGSFKYVCRLTVNITFDNDTPSSSDYNANRQYTIRAHRVPLVSPDKELYEQEDISVVSAYWENLTSYVASYDDASAADQNPIDSATKANLNVGSFRILATDQIQTAIDNVNYEATAYALAYSGLGSGYTSWTNTLTKNPASAFLKVLTDPLINKEPLELTSARIDWESLEEWYTFCEDKSLECNVYEVSEVTLQSTLTNICSTAMASWNVVDNKYTIIIDTYNTNIIQYFTPRNSSGFSATKAFNDIPTCLKMKFIDSENGYIEAERYVYNDSYNGDPRSTDTVEEMELYGAMSASQAWRLGRYSHAVARLRPEVFTFTADLEYIMCTRGDRIKLNHDVPLFGLLSARVAVPLESVGETTGVSLDEIVQFENGKDYAVTIRLKDGTSISANVTNPEIDTKSVLFETPISGTGIILGDELVLFGELGSVDVDLIVEKIEPNSDLGATLTCIEYNEAIYTADSGTIPAYNPKISKGGKTALSVGSLPKTQQEKVLENQQSIIVSDKVTYSMSAAYPESFQATTVMGQDASSYDKLNYLYVNYDDGNKIYKTGLLGGSNGTAINAVSSRLPYLYGDYIYYINQDAEGQLYQKGKDTLTDGVSFTTNPVYKYCIDKDIGDIYYINPLDNNYIYYIESGTSGNGVLFKDIPCGEVGFDSGILFILKLEDGFIYSIDMADTDIVTPYYTRDTIQEFKCSLSGHVYYLKSDDLIIYKKSTSTIGVPDNEGTPLFGVVTRFGVTDAGDLIYSSPSYSGFMFIGLSIRSIQDATLEAEANTFTITGDINAGSDIITNLSADDLDQIVVRDRVVHPAFPDDTFIRLKGNNFAYTTLPATASFTLTPIAVYGTRIVLNANRVIIPGTVTAELLESSAINSKAKTNGGFNVSKFDLDTGDITIRKQDDTKIFDFDAYTGNLSMAGDLDIGEDEAKRHVQVGSKGLLVEDSNGITIHDIPDQPVISGGFYAGHLYFGDVDDASAIITSNLSLTSTWQTIQAKTYSNSNVKAVYLTVQFTAGGLSRFVARPNGSSWGPSYAAPRIDISSTNPFASVPIICPVDSSGKFQVWGSGVRPKCTIWQMGAFI